MFKKAEKSQSKLWCAIYGASGSGKTMSALRIATGMGAGKIAVIDTERGSAAKYADRFNFDVCELKHKKIENYLQTIKEAGEAGYGVLIIDSMTHAWNELIEDVENLAKLKYGGNTFRAWSEGTPKQKDFIDGVLAFPGHVIVTMRSKTEWAVETNDKGKMAPKKIGLAPEQGKNIEYEFDLLLTMSDNNVAKVEKDRTGKFHGQFIEKPGEDFGKLLSAWLNSGVAKVAETKPVKAPKQETKAETITDKSLLKTAKDLFKKDVESRGLDKTAIQLQFDEICNILFGKELKKFSALTDDQLIDFINHYTSQPEVK